MTETPEGSLELMVNTHFPLFCFLGPASKAWYSRLGLLLNPFSKEQKLAPQINPWRRRFRAASSLL